MLSSRTILKSLENVNQYLSQFHVSKRSTYFELLIAEVFSHIFYLPFYSSDNDDTKVYHRTVWCGKINPFSKASGREPDAISYCYNFHLIIEATLKTGTKQWSQEFAQSIRHCKDFCSQNSINPKDVFILLVCTEINRDVYCSIKNNPRQEYRLIPIKVSELTRILKTSILAFTMKHLQLRRLFHEIFECVRDSSSIRDLTKSVDESICGWQENVLKLEKNTFIGVKSYEAMRKIGRTHIGVSEILQKLQDHWVVTQYFNIIGDKISNEISEDSLVQQSLASRLTPTYEGEELFEPVPYVDFKGRSLRLIDAVMRIK